MEMKKIELVNTAKFATMEGPTMGVIIANKLNELIEQNNAQMEEIKANSVATKEEEAEFKDLKKPELQILAQDLEGYTTKLTKEELIELIEAAQEGETDTEEGE